MKNEVTDTDIEDRARKLRVRHMHEMFRVIVKHVNDTKLNFVKEHEWQKKS